MLPGKQIPAGHLGGRGLRPDPLESMADPLDIFEKIYAGYDADLRNYSFDFALIRCHFDAMASYSTNQNNQNREVLK